MLEKILKYISENYEEGVDWKSGEDCKTCIKVLNQEMMKDEVILEYFKYKRKKATS